MLLTMAPPGSAPANDCPNGATSGSARVLVVVDTRRRASRLGRDDEQTLTGDGANVSVTEGRPLPGLDPGLPGLRAAGEREAVGGGPDRDGSVGTRLFVLFSRSRRSWVTYWPSTKYTALRSGRVEVRVVHLQRLKIRIPGGSDP